jgi:hypothetical protein
MISLSALAEASMTNFFATFGCFFDFYKKKEKNFTELATAYCSNIDIKNSNTDG